jgi:hypothetical protein
LLRRLGCLVGRLLVRGIASSTSSAITTTIPASRDKTTSSTKEAPGAAAAAATTAAASASTSRHAGDVCALGGDLDVPALEHAVIQNQGLCDQARLSELDVGIPVEQ